MIKHAIYMIICLSNDKVYIGSAVDVHSRLRTHKSNLNLNKHPNKHLQAAYNIYGSDQFDFRILEYIPNKKNLLDRENAWIDWFKASDRELGFNKRGIANSNLGIKKPHSPETVLKIGLGNKGKIVPKDVVEKIASKLRGRKRSPEQILKAIEGKRIKSGFAQSESNKIKIGKANSKPDLWPHANKSFCKCRDCLNKKNEQSKIRRIKKAEARKHSKVLVMVKGEEIKWVN